MVSLDEEDVEAFWGVWGIMEGEKGIDKGCGNSCLEGNGDEKKGRCQGAEGLLVMLLRVGNVVLCGKIRLEDPWTG